MTADQATKERQVSFHHSKSQESEAKNRLSVPGLAGGLSYERIDSKEQEVEGALQEAGLVTPPDGGFGWVIVAASFIINVIVDGVNFTAGQGFVPQWEQHYNATSGDTAWSVSLLTGFYLLAGPFVSALANFYGCRLVCIIGTLLSCAGFVATIFAPSLPVLLVTFGVVGGIGFGMMYLPAIVIVSYYFQKRRALATGIAACGSGIGMFTFAPLISILIDEIGWKGTLGIVAAITSVGALGALLFRPLTVTEEQVDKVVEIALKHAVSTSKDNLNDGDEKTERVLSLLAQSTSQEDGEQSQTVHDKLLARDSSAIHEDAETTLSPHVHHGVQIERFVDAQSPRKHSTKLDASKSRLMSRRSRSTLQQLTPFKSALELRARASTLRLPQQQTSTVDIYREASRDAVRTLNKPLSRMDIFYMGSAYSLNRRTSTHPGSPQPVTKPLALSRASVYEVCSEAPEITSFDNIKAVLLAMLDFDLLRSPSFLLLAFGGFLTMCGFFVPFMYISRAATENGIEESSALFLISIIGIVNIIGRVMCGWLSDHPKMNALTVHNVAVTIGGVATIAVPFLNSYWMYIVYCVLFGIGIACFGSLRSIICVELLGLEKLTSAYGFLMLFMGIAALLGAPIAGTLYDKTQSYALTFYVMGTCIAVSGIIGFPLMKISRWEHRNKERDEMEPTGSEEPTHKYDKEKYYVDS